MSFNDSEQSSWIFKGLHQNFRLKTYLDEQWWNAWNDDVRSWRCSLSIVIWLVMICILGPRGWAVVTVLGPVCWHYHSFILGCLHIIRNFIIGPWAFQWHRLSRLPSGELETSIVNIITGP